MNTIVMGRSTPPATNDPLLRAAYTGWTSLDRLAPLIVAAARKHLGAAANEQTVKHLMAILYNESKGNPRWYLGDVNFSGGPSVGPMQVYRKTAIDLGLWKPVGEAGSEADRAAYTAIAKDEARGIDMGVRVFKSKLTTAKGDVALAVRMYNGSGPAAEAYKTKALDFVRQTWA